MFSFHMFLITTCVSPLFEAAAVMTVLTGSRRRLDELDEKFNNKYYLTMRFCRLERVL
jgi:hypothetical protein